jgi:hypothetical protein
LLLVAGAAASTVRLMAAAARLVPLELVARMVSDSA